MALINLQDITLSYGGEPVLDRLNLQIEPGERVCLVGRNGEGKSTLMKVLAGELVPDRGEIIRQQGLRVARLSQEIPTGETGRVHEVVAGGLGGAVELLARHHELLNRLGGGSGERDLDELAALEHEIESVGAWQAHQRIEIALSRLGLDAGQGFAALSGGMKRRVLLARALVLEPDLLLLDEPTNHLDIEAIIWLEEFLLNCRSALLFVTHDRDLLKKLAGRIVDLDRGRITSWPGDYARYIERRDEMLAVEMNQRARFDRKLAEEEVWIRKGIKARRTRNEGRVRALMALREERRKRREQMGRVRMGVSSAPLSGKLVAVLKDVSFSYDGHPVIKELSTTVLRGDKIGIIGPNGAGKTTLLKIVLGELVPSTGKVRTGTNLAPVYFDQQRAVLDPAKSVMDNLTEGGDTLEVNGRRRHAIGYLKDFLFAPDRARSPVGILSGGEKNRLLLARLFARESNILVLDEPTNDLDMETLELLEELLLDYRGTILLVSHDRAFLNRVVTSTLVFEGEGRVVEYAGGYDDWLCRRPASAPVEPTVSPVKRSRERAKTVSSARRLTYRENQELERLPGEIEGLEEEQERLYERMADPDFYRTDEVGEAARVRQRSKEIEEILERSYARWEELERLREG